MSLNWLANQINIRMGNMVYEILKNYLPQKVLLQRFIPLKVDVRSPDYYLYLYASDEAWFVVLEFDYIFINEAVRDVEKSFPVKVEGWCTLLEHQQKTGRDLLPRDTFKSDHVNETDGEWEGYHAVAYKKGNTYALLRVIPDPGVDIGSFGLSWPSRDTKSA
jgi:hypothetical protein